MLCLSALLALPLLVPQSTSVELQFGDPLLAMGRVEEIGSFSVTNAGSWLAFVRSNQSSARDRLLLREGLPALLEGDQLPNPPGSRVRDFNSLDSVGPGDIVWRVELFSGGLETDEREGLYWNARLIAQRHRELAPLFQEKLHQNLGPDLRWAELGAPRFGSKNHYGFVAEILQAMDELTPSVLFEVEIDDNGEIVATHRRALSGDELTFDVPTTLRWIDPRGVALSINRRGDFLWAGKSNLPVFEDGVLMQNATLLAREGQPAPVPGRRYGSFEGCELALNDRGDYAFTCHLESDPLRPDEVSSNFLLVRNGQAFAQEGDVLFALGSPLDNQRETPLFLGPAGEVFWGAKVRGPFRSQDEAYLRNHEVLIQEGVTEVAGRLVLGLENVPDAFHVSRNGRFFFARVQLEVSNDQSEAALVSMDLGSIAPLPGCREERASLELVGGLAIAGGRIEFLFDDAQTEGSQGFLLVSNDTATDSSGCGLIGPFGELLLRPPFLETQAGPIWIADGAPFALNLPPDPLLVDAAFGIQGFFVAPPNPRPGTTRLKSTQAWRIEIGAP